MYIYNEIIFNDKNWIFSFKFFLFFNIYCSFHYFFLLELISMMSSKSNVNTKLAIVFCNFMNFIFEYGILYFPFKEKIPIIVLILNSKIRNNYS